MKRRDLLFGMMLAPVAAPLASAVKSNGGRGAYPGRLMVEPGPELILPLTRGCNGEITAQGSGYGYGGGDGGEKILKFMIEQIERKFAHRHLK